MSTNIERAAEVIRRVRYAPGGQSQRIADALAAEGLLVTDEQQQLRSILGRIRSAHGARCPAFGHDGAPGRRKRVDCSDDQCQNPECVRFIDCSHPWHLIDEALTEGGT